MHQRTLEFPSCLAGGITHPVDEKLARSIWPITVVADVGHLVTLVHDECAVWPDTRQAPRTVLPRLREDGRSGRVERANL